jgi:catechol 2,3-dioxygenase-like lactoylglutathione lyase family enzyme
LFALVNLMSTSMIQAFDHVVMTCRNLDATVDFYTRVLGMRLEIFGEPPKPQRKALRFGDQKFNLHQAGDKNVTDIYAKNPTPGSLDLCLLAAVPLDDVIAQLKAENIAIEAGPDKRTGARWPIRSVYLRDPDNNLVEISEQWKE